MAAVHSSADELLALVAKHKEAYVFSFGSSSDGLRQYDCLRVLIRDGAVTTLADLAYYGFDEAEFRTAHFRHCYTGPESDYCKYGDEDCPAKPVLIGWRECLCSPKHNCGGKCRPILAKACDACDGTGRYGDGKHDGSGRWIECAFCGGSGYQ